MIRRLFRLLPARTQQFLHQMVGSIQQANGFWRGQKLTDVPMQPASRDSDASAGFTNGASNPLSAYFDRHIDGPGIWKWRHYFEIYHRHFQKLIGQDVNVLEVGIYSGGSLGMWTDYFGPRCNIYGVDLEPSCSIYESGRVKVFIGDQADRAFWKKFREQVPALDVIIDDGGHRPHQQIVTLEETLGHLKPGGVYVCEDVQGVSSRFIQYINGLAQNLNASTQTTLQPDVPERQIVTIATPFQSAIHSVHMYPYVVVIEKNPAPIAELVAPKHGTQWQPYSGHK